MNQQIEIVGKDQLDTFELLRVAEDMRARGVDRYTVRPGNDCVWVTYPVGGVQVDMYYVFDQGRLVDQIVD